MKNKTLLSLLFGLLLIGGWYSLISGRYQINKEYKEYVSLGDEKYEKTLYQEAITYYQEALNLKMSKSVQNKLLDAHEAFYDETESYSSRNAWIQALDEACIVYPKVDEYWEKEIELCIEAEDYEKALTVCKNAYEAGVSSEKYKSLKEQVKYSYDEKTEYCSGYRNAVNGFFVTSVGTKWNWITSDGEDDSEDFQELGYIGEDNYFLCKTENGEVCFYDLEGVKRGIIDEEVSDFGLYSEGYCSVKHKDGYAFIDLEGELLADGMKECGSFQNGYAPVQLASGKWGMLGTDGVVNELDLEEIVYDYAGRYIFNDTIILKNEGVYQFWDSDLQKPINEFTCVDIDIPTNDEIVAYQDKNGKWGYVDYQGNVVIEPEYEAAKSFSNGLAAVSVDGKWGYIDKNNNVVVDCIYYECGYLSEAGVCFVSDKENFYKMLVFKFPDLIR